MWRLMIPTPGQSIGCLKRHETGLSPPMRGMFHHHPILRIQPGLLQAPGSTPRCVPPVIYPAAPELARGNDLTPAEKFWVIKHGIKSTGMAAWGKTHNDTLIWNMVAFLQKLPGLSADQYQTLVKAAPEGHDEMMKEQDGGQDPAASDHHDDDMGHPH